MHYVNCSIQIDKAELTVGICVLTLASGRLPITELPDVILMQSNRPPLASTPQAKYRRIGCTICPFVLGRR